MDIIGSMVSLTTPMGPFQGIVHKMDSTTKEVQLRETFFNGKKTQFPIVTIKMDDIQVT